MTKRMRMERPAIVLAVSLSFSAPIMAASVVRYSLGLQSATSGPYVDYVANYPNQMYASGSQSDGLVFQPDDKITWDMTLTAGGIQDSWAGIGYEIQSVANFVYDLELHAGSASGPLVTNAAFMSDVNSSASAAFCQSFNIEGFGPGRVIDNIMTGGPLLAVHTYPTNLGNGVLYGMGAGYLPWRGAGPDRTTPGVGSGLGLVPVTEGQIDLTGLASGDYVLAVIPGNGTNVLRGDIDLGIDQSAFATPAERTIGDAITFTIVPEPMTVSLLALGGVMWLRRRQQ